MSQPHSPAENHVIHRRLGNLEIWQIVESIPPGFGVADLFPDIDLEAFAAHRDWLHPGIIDLDQGLLVLVMQSYLVKTPRHLILIDACVGEHKERLMPPFHDKTWPWLDNLAAAGFTPEDVDFVFCTHLHMDHVGWNTRLENGKWVPTFPNAKYLFGKLEFDFWQEVARTRTEPDPTGPYFEDSVLPVLEAGLAEFVDDGFALDSGLTVALAPGHTAGNMIVEARSQGARGVFSGDVIHTPLQCRYPDITSHFCADAEASRRTRRALLESCVEHGSLLLPAHFPLPSAGFLSVADAGFHFRPANPEEPA